MNPLKIALLVLFIPFGIFAQESDDIIIGKKTSIHSEVLNEDRDIWIGLPDNYEAGSDVYPVMYLLDGPSHFHHTTGIIKFMNSNNLIPDMIVVAVGNTDRTRDLTPPVLSEMPDSITSGLPETAGGADNFLKFIQDELIPYVDNNYRTAPYKLLVGHSFGGLFAVHTLIKQPDLFNAYIAISPSLWYDNQAFLEPAEKLLKARDTLNVTFYMTMGNEGGSMLGGAMKLAALFEENNIHGFEAKFNPMPAETHGSVPHRSTYDGLEFIYSDYEPPIPSTYEEFLAIMADGGAEKLIGNINGHYKKLSDKYGYRVSDESTINQLGYILLQEKRVDDAIMAFERNTKNYPESANAFDSLGDGYKAAGRTEDARQSYTHAVELAEKNNDPVGEVSAAKLAELSE